MGKLAAFCRLLILLLTHFPCSKNAFLGVSWTLLGSAEYFNAQIIPLERKIMRLCQKKKKKKKHINQNQPSMGIVQRAQLKVLGNVVRYIY